VGRSSRTNSAGQPWLPNKRMKLTKLSAAWLPEWTCRLMPALVKVGRGHRFAAYPRCWAG
jgi:hypothetical protein